MDGEGGSALEGGALVEDLELEKEVEVDVG